MTAPARREGELAEQCSGQAADEADRGIDGGERQRHGDHRHGDLARPAQGRLARGEAIIDMALDVLDDDDGVIDHEPDRQHHGEQRQ